MSHQPFENYLFLDEPLTDEQKQSLKTHLRDCERCYALAYALKELDTALLESPSPTPAPGFTHRWQTHLAAYRQTRQNRNLWLMTITLLGLAGLTMLITIMLCNLLHFNWAYEQTQAIARLSLFAAQARQFVFLLSPLKTILPILIPVLMLFGTAILVALSALVITWFNTIIKLYSPVYERGKKS